MTQPMKGAKKPKKKRAKHSCIVCGHQITAEESERHDCKCQICWSRQLAADLDEMFGEDLDVEMILRDSMKR